MFCARSDGPATTRALATALADLVSDGDLLVLTGDLGAGKTCFTQGLGAGLGVQERITSPTFTLAAEYEGRLRLHHLDVYRLDGPADTTDLDLHELAEDGVTVVEWGEQIDTALGADRLVIEIAFLDPDDPTEPAAIDSGAASGEDGEFVVDDRRRFRFRPVGERWQTRAAALADTLAPWEAPC